MPTIKGILGIALSSRHSFTTMTHVKTLPLTQLHYRVPSFTKPTVYSGPTVWSIFSSHVVSLLTHTLSGGKRQLQHIEWVPVTQCRTKTKRLSWWMKSISQSPPERCLWTGDLRMNTKMFWWSECKLLFFFFLNREELFVNGFLLPLMHCEKLALTESVQIKKTSYSDISSVAAGRMEI